MTEIIPSLSATEYDPVIDREPTPSTQIIDRDGKRWATLHKGAIYILDSNTVASLESKDSVADLMGIEASLIAEIDLGGEYPLFLLDRGCEAQGQETVITPYSELTVSDRYLLADAAFLMRANINSGLKKDLSDMTGLIEFCANSSFSLGRAYSFDNHIDTSKMPNTVSRKHASVSIDFDGKIYIGDNNSANLTIVHHKI